VLGVVWQGLAAAVAVAHLTMVLFLVAGGFLARRRRRLRGAHVAVASAVVTVAVMRAPCPLTQLELWLRQLGGVQPYRGGFIEHYLVAPVHPAGVTPGIQLLLYAIVATTNIVAYAGPTGVAPRPRRRRRADQRPLLRQSHH
jgi:hypothetical protein